VVPPIPPTPVSRVPDTPKIRVSLIHAGDDGMSDIDVEEKPTKKERKKREKSIEPKRRSKSGGSGPLPAPPLFGSIMSTVKKPEVYKTTIFAAHGTDIASGHDESC
jgi:hypothetical protein